MNKPERILTRPYVQTHVQILRTGRQRRHGTSRQQLGRSIFQSAFGAAAEPATCPPSTVNSVPVMYDASSEASSSAMAATSSGVPNRRIGVSATKAAHAGLAARVVAEYRLPHRRQDGGGVDQVAADVEGLFGAIECTPECFAHGNAGIRFTPSRSPPRALHLGAGCFSGTDAR